MPSIRQTRLIPILAIAALVLIAIAIFKGRDDTPSHEPMQTVPTPPAPAPDADSPADTIRALTAEVQSMKQENMKLREDSTRLNRQNDELNRNRSAIEENVTRKLTEQFSQPDASSSPVFSGLNRRIDELSALVERYAPEQAAGGSPSQARGTDIPPGLGFDNAGSPAPSAGFQVTQPAQPAVPGGGPSGTAALVWSEPLGSRTVVGPDGQPKVVKAIQAPTSTPAALPPAATDLGVADPAMPEPPPTKAGTAAAAVQPYFTVPENATLMDATAMTALIGRTPVNGNVRDPLEFKVLIGRTNLAANGFEVPADVTGMVVSGIAVGDWMLSCIEGHIHSATFVFQDGSIRTVSKRGHGGAATGGQTQRLGFISDERGAGCINGERITNAPAYLTQVVGMKSLEVAALAAAVSQTTTSANGLGSTTAVTGNKGQFVLGQAAAGGVDEVSNWLMKRLNDSFDAVYVKPGAKVAVHVTEALEIDKDPNPRKLDHGTANRATQANRAGLD